MDFRTCFIIFDCSSDYWIKKKSLAIFPFGDMSHCLFFFDARVCSVCVEAFYQLLCSKIVLRKMDLVCVF